MLLLLLAQIWEPQCSRRGPICPGYEVGVYPVITQASCSLHPCVFTYSSSGKGTGIQGRILKVACSWTICFLPVFLMILCPVSSLLLCQRKRKETEIRSPLVSTLASTLVFYCLSITFTSHRDARKHCYSNNVHGHRETGRDGGINVARTTNTAFRKDTVAFISLAKGSTIGVQEAAKPRKNQLKAAIRDKINSQAVIEYS